MISGAKSTNSAACVLIWSLLPPAHRYSMRRLRTTSRSVLRNIATSACPVRSAVRDTPMRQTLPGYCPRATSDHAAAAPPSSDMNSRRSLDHFVGKREQAGRHFKAERLRRFEIDRKLKFSRLLDRKLAWLLAAQDAIDIRGSAPEYIVRIGPVRHQPAFPDKRAIGVNRGKPVTRRRCGDQFVMRDGERLRRNDQAAAPFMRKLGDSIFDLRHIVNWCRRQLDPKRW